MPTMDTTLGSRANDVVFEQYVTNIEPVTASPIVINTVASVYKFIGASTVSPTIKLPSACELTGRVVGIINDTNISISVYFGNLSVGALAEDVTRHIYYSNGDTMVNLVIPF